MVSYLLSFCCNLLSSMDEKSFKKEKVSSMHIYAMNFGMIYNAFEKYIFLFRIFFLFLLSH